jgi:hypothetical protein
LLKKKHFNFSPKPEKYFHQPEAGSFDMDLLCPKVEIHEDDHDEEDLVEQDPLAI